MRPSALAQAIDFHFAIDRPLGILGDPGIGKSQIVAAATERYGLPLVVMNLVLSDSTDFSGLPFLLTLPDGTQVTEWVKQRLFLQREPYVLFLDELFQAPVATMNVAAPIILEKRVGDIQLPPDCRVIFASNKASNKAGTNRVPSHIPNRATMVELEVSNDDWLLHAMQSGMPEVLPAFMMMRPNLLHDFDPSRMVNATPRQWFGVGNMINAGLPEDIKFDCIAGCVGEGPAAEFIGFEKIMGQVPTREQILMNSETTPVPEDPSAQYAIAGMLIQNTTGNNFDTVVQYMQRMPEDFQAMFCKEVLRLQPTVTSCRGYVKWAIRFGAMLS